MPRELVGRRKDLDHLVAWLGAPSSHAIAVELVGDPGIGKTALLDGALGEVRGGSLARIAATAVPATVARRSHRSRRRARRTRPGRERACVAGRARRGRAPVVLAVDDAHWLDEATAGVLAFAVRANRDRPVRLVCARRPIPSPLEPVRSRTELAAKAPSGHDP